MKLEHPFFLRLGGFSIATFTRHWLSTLDYQACFYNRNVDPAHSSYAGPAVFLFWHEYIFLPLYLRGHCNLAMLLSQHRDAQWLAEAARLLGFGTVRGSSSRGGGSALLELMVKGEQMNLAITPDGPRGPRRHLSQGAVYLSSKTGLPLVLLGLGFERPWRLPTWDRFALPRPFRRARGVVSPRIHIPPGLDRAGLEHYRQRIEGLLNWLTSAAEDWAARGGRYCEQVAVNSCAMPLAVRRQLFSRPQPADAPATPSPPNAAPHPATTFPHAA